MGGHRTGNHLKGGQFISPNVKYLRFGNRGTSTFGTTTRSAQTVKAPQRVGLKALEKRLEDFLEYFNHKITNMNFYNCFSFPKPVDKFKGKNIEEYNIFTVIERNTVIIQGRLTLEIENSNEYLEAYPWVEIPFDRIKKSFEPTEYSKSIKNKKVELKGVLLNELPFANLYENTEVIVDINLEGQEISPELSPINRINPVRLDEYENWISNFSRNSNS